MSRSKSLATISIRSMLRCTASTCYVRSCCVSTTAPPSPTRSCTPLQMLCEAVQAMRYSVENTTFLVVPLDEWRGMMQRAVAYAHGEVNGKYVHELSTNQVGGAHSRNDNSLALHVTPNPKWHGMSRTWLLYCTSSIRLLARARTIDTRTGRVRLLSRARGRCSHEQNKVALTST